MFHACQLRLAFVAILAGWQSLLPMAGEEAVQGSCGESGANCGNAGQKVRQLKDGRTFIFDPAIRAWKLKQEQASGTQSEAVQLALPWSQFNVSFEGEFQIAGAPILTGADPARRHQNSQEHADTGSSIWDGAVALSKVIEQIPKLVRGQHVLELGAGRGVAGLAAAAAGAKHVVLTDLAYCLQALKHAAQLTEDASPALSGVVEVAELDWSKASDFLDRHPDERFDVLLAADVVWLSDLVPLLVSAIGAIAHRNPGIEILVLHQTRSSSVEIAFLEAMAAQGFELRWDLPGGAARETSIGVAWHSDFVPDSRIKLWCFHLLDLASNAA